MDQLDLKIKAFLRANAVSFGFRGPRGTTDPVLRNISIEGNRGDTIAIMGRSGIGKTTLCRVLAGLVELQEGTIFIDGEPLTGPTTQVAISFQESPCFPWLTAAENVGFVNKRNDSSVVEHLMSELGLNEVKDKYPKDLSGGMRQRVAIGRALMVQPSCLILDEPFSALDMITKRQLQELLRKEQSARDLLLVVVLHSLEDAVAIANRLVVLGSQPASVVAEIPIDGTTDFRALRDHVSNLLTEN
jgi:NitT/TauT family transport system ATP-binding protein